MLVSLVVRCSYVLSFVFGTGEVSHDSSADWAHYLRLWMDVHHVQVGHSLHGYSALQVDSGTAVLLGIQVRALACWELCLTR